MCLSIMGSVLGPVMDASIFRNRLWRGELRLDVGSLDSQQLLDNWSGENGAKHSLHMSKYQNSMVHSLLSSLSTV